MLGALRGCYELVAIAATVLYMLFLVRMVWPDAYRRLLAWLADWWQRIRGYLSRSDQNDKLNRMWEIGGSDG